MSRKAILEEKFESQGWYNLWWELSNEVRVVLFPKSRDANNQFMIFKVAIFLSKRFSNTFEREGYKPTVQIDGSFEQLFETRLYEMQLL